LLAEKGNYYLNACRCPLSLFPNGKGVVCGLPKSGNTWLVSLLRDYLEMDTVLLLDGKPTSGIGMTHKPYSYGLSIRPDFARGVYIMRDLRDMLVSYYHYSQTDYYRELNDPYQSFDSIEAFYYQYFLSILVHRYDWWNHAEAYTSHAIPVVRYEDLFDAPQETFKRVLSRMSLSVDETRIKQVVEKNQLKRVKQEGQALWHSVPTTHFRKGGYGNYKDELPESVIQHLEKEFGSYLTRWGYPLETA